MDVQIEQATVDLVLEEDEEYLFEIVGKKYIHLNCSWLYLTSP
jgi:FK506-binding nuclear protein